MDAMPGMRSIGNGELSGVGTVGLHDNLQIRVQQLWPLLRETHVASMGFDRQERQSLSLEMHRLR